MGGRFGKGFCEFFWQLLSKEDNIWFDGSFIVFILARVPITPVNFTVSNLLLQYVLVKFGFTSSTACAFISSVTLQDCIHIHTRLFLKIVNILSKIFPQNALILQHFNEEVSWGRIKLLHIKVGCKLIKWFWVL